MSETEPLQRIVLAPVVRITAPTDTQRSTLLYLLVKNQKRVKPNQTVRVGQPEGPAWYYRVMEIHPAVLEGRVNSATQIEIAPRYRDFESVFTFRVAHAYPSDEGRGFVRMEPSQMLLYGLDRADYLAISPEGKSRRIGVQVFATKGVDVKLPIIRMDRMIRDNLNVKVGDFVQCQGIRKQIARTVVFRPADPKYALLVSSSLLKERFIHAPVTTGQVFRIKGYVRKIPPPTHPNIEPFSKVESHNIMVDKTDPIGIVVIDKPTEIVVENQDPSGSDSS